MEHLRLDHFLEHVVEPHQRRTWRQALEGAKDANKPALFSRQAFERLVDAVSPFVLPEEQKAFVDYVETQFLDQELAHNAAMKAHRRASETHDDT